MAQGRCMKCKENVEIKNGEEVVMEKSAAWVPDRTTIGAPLKARLLVPLFEMVKL